MNSLKIISVNLCGCCAIVAANGDDSGCRSYYEHDEHALTASTGYVSVDDRAGDDETFTCDGCGWRIEHGALYLGSMDITNV